MRLTTVCHFERVIGFDLREDVEQGNGLLNRNRIAEQEQMNEKPREKKPLRMSPRMKPSRRFMKHFMTIVVVQLGRVAARMATWLAHWKVSGCEPHTGGDYFDRQLASSKL
jgi:hypothetical protein